MYFFINLSLSQSWFSTSIEIFEAVYVAIYKSVPLNFQVQRGPIITEAEII